MSDHEQLKEWGRAPEWFITEITASRLVEHSRKLCMTCRYFAEFDAPCVYFCAELEDAPILQHNGFCRRYPPIYNDGSELDEQCCFPVVDWHDWCGEWARR